MVGGATRMPQIQRAVAEFFGAAAAHQPQSGPGRGAGRGDAGQRAGRQSRRGDDWLLLDVIPLSLGLETMGGLAEKIVPRNSTIPGRARAGVHDVQGRPDRDRAARRAGRAREGRRLPLAGALRAARHPADGRRRGAHPRDLPGRRRRPAVGVGARAHLAASRRRSRSSRPTGFGRRHRAHAAGFVRARGRRHGRARAGRGAGRGRPDRRGDRARAGRGRRPARRGRARGDRRARSPTCARRADGDDRRALAAATAALNQATAEFAARAHEPQRRPRPHRARASTRSPEPAPRCRKSSCCRTPKSAPTARRSKRSAGVSICDNLLAQGIEIEHACEKSCACTTCHVIVREGFESLRRATEDEDDLLDRAWGLTPQSRLSCQAIVDDADARRRDPELHDQLRQRAMALPTHCSDGDAPMKWTDTRDIAIALAEAHPDVDPAHGALHRPAPLGLRAAGLRRRPGRSGEKILEAIQMAWIDEAD